MDKRSEEIFDKLVSFELLISQVYMRFSRLFPEDADFWWRLALEEKGHASIIRGGCETFAPMNLFPPEFTEVSLVALQEALDEKEALIREIDNAPSSFDRRKAFLTAIRIEEKDVEHIFEELMTRAPANRALALFQQLNEESCGHAKRILERLSLLS